MKSMMQVFRVLVGTMVFLLTAFVMSCQDEKPRSHETLQGGGSADDSSVEDGMSQHMTLDGAMTHQGPDSGMATSEDGGMDHCVVNSLPDGGFPLDGECTHIGTGDYTCCAITASKYHVDNQCQGPSQTLVCIMQSSVSMSCAFGAAEACYVRTLADGGVEYWTSFQTYEAYDDLVGVPCDNALSQQLLSSPSCPQAQ